MTDLELVGDHGDIGGWSSMSSISSINFRIYFESFRGGKITIHTNLTIMDPLALHIYDGDQRLHSVMTCPGFLPE